MSVVHKKERKKTWGNLAIPGSPRKSLYIKCGKVSVSTYVCTSVTLGVASDATALAGYANMMMMMNAGRG